MKWALFLLVTTVFAGYFARGQKLTAEQIPIAVKNAFEKEYHGTKASWDKEGTNYEANFKQHGKTMSVLIERSGTIVETETSIPVTDLPKAVQDYMKKNYPGVKIEEAARILKANSDVNYEAEVHHKDIVFDANGKFIKEVKD
jgi:hypothetical protein